MSFGQVLNISSVKFQRWNQSRLIANPLRAFRCLHCPQNTRRFTPPARLSICNRARLISSCKGCFLYDKTVVLFLLWYGNTSKISSKLTLILPLPIIYLSTTSSQLQWHHLSLPLRQPAALAYRYSSRVWYRNKSTTERMSSRRWHLRHSLNH